MSTEDPRDDLETPEGFGATVRRLRKERHISLYAFAEKTGLSLSYLSSLERGQRDVSFATIRAIAEGLGVPMQDLFGPPEGIPAGVVDLVRMFAAAPPEWRSAIWEVLTYEPTARPADDALLKELDEVIASLKPGAEVIPIWTRFKERYGETRPRAPREGTEEASSALRSTGDEEEEEGAEKGGEENGA